MVEGGRDWTAFTPTRPLRRARPSRGALLSAFAHGALFAALLLVRGSSDPPANEIASFITAEIVPLALPATPTQVPGATVEPAAPVAPPHEAPPPAAPRAAVATAPRPPEPAPAEPVDRRGPVESPAPPAAAASEPPRVAAESSPAPPLAQPAADGRERAPEEARGAPPGPTLEPHEQEALRRRLSSWTGQFTADAAERALSWRDDGQEYTAVLRPLATADETGMQQLAVEVTTERGGERLTTELRMTRLAFSNFGQFVNRWDPKVGLHDDVIDGRFHSNTAVNVIRTGSKMPVFGGRVTIADGDVTLTDGDAPGPSRERHLNRRTTFPAGIETSVRRIALPERALADPATPNSQRFERDTALTFYADGSVGWRDVDGVSESKRTLGVDPFYLLAGEDVALRVQGTVDGKVLVYSPTRIVIVGDLHYAADPRTPNADDYLGLVTEGTVEIAEPDVTGPGDLEVYASIYAGRRFDVREAPSRRSGVLLIHGSLTAGSLSASEPRFGFHIEFDNRLTTMRAPGFPLSDRYELDSTSGEWRVVPQQ